MDRVRNGVSNPVLVEVTRGPFVESRHRGAIVVVDTAGKRRAALGEVEAAVFPRSAVKAIQALPLVESGAAHRYGFGNRELALACASHSGEPLHIATARAMLAAAGRSESDLECGAQVPLNHAAADALVRAGVEPGPLCNNCSGKHAGFICVACHMGVAPQGYVEPDHPAMREVTSALEDMTGTPLGPERAGIDGCSIPVFAIPLDRLALAFARLVTGEGLRPSRAVAARRLVTACQTEPFMVGGTGRLETDAMNQFGSRLFIKGGAEGVSCLAFPEHGLGVAIKCEDGAGRAAEVLAKAAIAAFLDSDYRADEPVLTRRGRAVGVVRPADGLVAALRGGEGV